MLRQSWSWGSWGALLAVALAAPRLLGAGFLARLPAVAARAAEAAVLYALYYAEWVLLAGLIFWGAWRLFVRTQWRAYSLCRAASNNRADVVARLLREGVAPDAYRDVIYGGIPLHFAAARGHAAVVRILASAGGARLLRLPLNNGCTSLHLAAENGHLDVVGALLDAVTPEERQGFLKKRAESGGTCLHFAVRKGHTHVAGALTRAGATDLVGMQDSHGDSCLHLAARTGRANMLEVLLGAGSDHNLQNDGGLTALHYAAAQGHVQAVRVLMRAGADPDIEDGRCWTALALARSHGHHGVITELESAGGGIRAVGANDSCTGNAMAGVGKFHHGSLSLETRKAGKGVVVVDDEVVVVDANTK